MRVTALPPIIDVFAGWVVNSGAIGSSLVIVPVPTAVPRVVVPVVFTTLESVTITVSSGSEAVSPFTVMLIGRVAAPPAVKLSVPAVTAA